MLGIREALLFLAVVVVAVPLFKRLGLGSVLGYLVAGCPHRPPRAPAHPRRGGGAAPRRARGGAAALPHRPRAAARAAVGAAARVFGVGGAPGRSERRGARGVARSRSASPGRRRWWRASGCRSPPPPSRCSCSGERNQLATPMGADGLRDPAVPGPGGDSAPRGPAPARRRAGRRADASWVPLAKVVGAGRPRRPGGAAVAAARLPARGLGPEPGGLHRLGAARSSSGRASSSRPSA